LLDEVDKCPDDPEDKDGFQDEDGCPDPDNDQDQILDVDDKCPLEPEDKDGFQDVDGCPDPDNDGDKILDVNDRCPMDPETVNGMDDEDGCPDNQRIIVTCDRLEIDGKIFFATAKAEIRPQSFELLDDIAKTLREHPDIKRVRIEGHTDSRGSADYNRELSASRAASVLTFLQEKGVGGERMTSEGFGEDQPIAGNDTPEGMARNRRVEFVILEREGCQR
ncbi:MAG: OmpA family protein, partial [Myxococcales bacterium]|nr:OmpA family protein [Myxococcales bacterium]